MCYLPPKFCLIVLGSVFCFKVLQNTHGLTDSGKGVWRSNRQLPAMEVFDLNEKHTGTRAGKMAQ